MSDHHGAEDDTNDLTAENENLQKELDVCRRELKTFRKELDNLVDQMAEMGTEVVDAKNKVSVYSRRLNEVEQELNSTQELNVNLQEQLRNSLEKQKQANSSTTQAMKQMQTELGRVASDSGALRSNLVELESRQEKCEGKVVEMISNTKEYADLLEEAQTTIQTLRTESDMDGRGWGHHPTMGSGWNKPRKQNSEPLSTLAMEDPELNHPDFPAEELDPHAWTDEPEVMPGTSLGSELGLGMSFNTVETEVQVEEDDEPSPPLTPASYQSPKQPTPELSPQLPTVVQHKETQTLAPPPPPPQPQPQQQQQQSPPQQLQRQQSTSPAPKNARKFSAHSFPSEFQQRLDDITTQQTAITGMARPPWNPSVTLEPEIANPARFRSRSVSRGPSISSQSSSRSVSQASQYLGTSAPVVSSMKKSRTLNSMPSLQASPSMAASSSSSSSLQETAAPGQLGRRSRSTASVTNSKPNRPRSRTAAATVEKSPVVVQQSYSSTSRASISSSSSSATKGSRNVSVSAAADKSAPKVKVITGGIKTQSPAALSPNESSSTEVKTVTSPSTASGAETGRTTPRSPRPASLSPVPGANPSGSMGSPA